MRRRLDQGGPDGCFVWHRTHSPANERYAGGAVEPGLARGATLDLQKSRQLDLREHQVLWQRLDQAPIQDLLWGAEHRGADLQGPAFSRLELAGFLQEDGDKDDGEQDED